MSEQPTVFHITHVKSGSQWVYQVLNECAPARIVKPRVKVAQFYEDAILPGMIYPTVYVPRGRFESTLKPQEKPNSAPDTPASKNWHNFVEQGLPVRTFVVIRDLRDTLISLYFSLKVSHAIISDNVAEGHRQLNQLDFEDGLLYLCSENAIRLQAEIQRSWLTACERGESLLIRYEDLIANELEGFEKIIRHCEIEVGQPQLEDIVARNSFASRAGRKPGEEDVSSHFRKGISGDWRNHFTDRITAEFKQRFGQHLVATGYEKDLNW